MHFRLSENIAFERRLTINKLKPFLYKQNEPSRGCELRDQEHSSQLYCGIDRSHYITDCDFPTNELAVNQHHILQTAEVSDVTDDG